jgi:hypothetical protein
MHKTVLRYSRANFIQEFDQNRWIKGLLEATAKPESHRWNKANHLKCN